MQALLNTPAAAKLYRAPQRRSTQRGRIDVADNAWVEWLPQETIVFDGAQTCNHLRFDLTGGARLIAWDIVCLGRPAAAETFRNGLYDSRIELCIDGELHWIERMRVPGAATSAFVDAAWGFDAQPILGTLIAHGFSDVPPVLMQALRDGHDAADRVGASVVDGLVILRALSGYVGCARAVDRRLAHAARRAAPRCSASPRWLLSG